MAEDEWIDRSNPHWPRTVSQVHLDADADHDAVGDDPGDGIFDNCAKCRLAVTSDGKRHGFDAQ